MGATKTIVTLAVLASLLVAKSNQAAVIESSCPVPENAQEWDPNPQLKTVVVNWTYGNGASCCSSRQECLGTHNTSSSSSTGRAVSQADKMKVQLKPVELQPGNKLIFHPDPNADTTFPFIFKVNQPSFLECRHQGWLPVTNEETNDLFEVDGSLLGPGNIYFIVESRGQTLCGNGLRVNVTVKTDECQRDLTQQECSGRGRCVTYKGQASYTCQCCGNFKGKVCEIYDACLSHPCYNGGECLYNDTAAGDDPTSHASDYHCKCPFGYSGDQCEKKVTNICDIVECQNEGTCTGNATHFECACPPGYTGNHCEVKINECMTSPCRHGQCVDRMNGFHCDCYPGYYGEKCEMKRTSCSLNACRNGGFCENKTVEYTSGASADLQCHCHPAWRGEVCTERVSPCQDDTCSFNGDCIEVNHGFVCQCAPGFEGSRCEVNVNECATNPCHYGGHCRDLVQGHTCLCITAHGGSNCEIAIAIYNPSIDDVDRATKLREENDNLYIMAAILSIVVILLAALLVVCYYRRNEGFGEFCGARIIALHRKKKNNPSLTVSVNANNTDEYALASNSMYDTLSSYGEVTNPAFDNQVV